MQKITYKVGNENAVDVTLNRMRDVKELVDLTRSVLLLEII